MKLLRVYLSISLCLLLSQFSVGQIIDAQAAGVSEHSCIHLKNSIHSLKKTKRQSTSSTANYNIKYQRLELEVDPNQYYIKGKVTSYFYTYSGLSNFQNVHFDLSDSLSIDSVYYHGQKISFDRDVENVVNTFLPQNIGGGVMDSVTLFYQGVPDSTDGRSFVQATHENSPVLWSLSEPFGSSTWWPCKDGLEDKIDSIDIIITTPSAYKAASNGLLINEYVNGPNTVFHWRHRYPIATYLVAFAVTNYERFTQTLFFEDGSTLDVENYVYPEDTADWQTTYGVTNAYMRLFVEKFGPYPFAKEKYGHAQFSGNGGMEHQTMSFMASTFPPLIGHEIAHQWFGNMVTCSTWKDIWLNEGLATFAEGLARERYWPKDWESWKEENIREITNVDGGSVYMNRFPSVANIFDGRLSYRKGAMLLHMLRWEIGDEAVFKAIRAYLNDPFTQYGFSSTDHLKNHLENASGKDLSDFFNNWFYGFGYPSFDIEVTQNNGFLKILSKQTSTYTQPFSLHLPLYVSGEGQDTIYRLLQRGIYGCFSVEIPFIADSVAFDPERWLISKNNTTTLIEGDANALEVFADSDMNLLTVTTDGPSEQVQIFSLDGKLLFTQENTENLFRVNISQWPAGIYIANARVNGKDYRAKTLVIR